MSSLVDRFSYGSRVRQRSAVAGAASVATSSVRPLMVRMSMIRTPISASATAVNLLYHDVPLKPGTQARVDRFDSRITGTGSGMTWCIARTPVACGDPSNMVRCLPDRAPIAGSRLVHHGLMR